MHVIAKQSRRTSIPSTENESNEISNHFLCLAVAGQLRFLPMQRSFVSIWDMICPPSCFYLF
eukprot:scaffold17668_cov67-Attheya_sp.AAC.4